MTTVPGSSTTSDELTARLAWATFYMGLGWPTFVLGRNKQPVALCDRCRTAPTYHDREACECLLCHGFYAATLDRDRIAQMIALHPEGQLAVRTGAASNLVVLDFESSSDGSELEVTGLDVLEQWEAWVGGWSLPKTLTARTESGGIHQLYSYASVGRRVRQKIRPLPAMDVKAEGGYIAVPCGQLGSQRMWLSHTMTDAVKPVSPELATWLLDTRPGIRPRTLGGPYGTTSGEPQGYDFQHARTNGPPVGMRDHFFNDLIFRGRKQGLSAEQVEHEALAIWERMPQDEPFPWDWVLYKIDRVFATVEPELSLSAIRQAYARMLNATTTVPVESVETPGHHRQGRVTIVPRERRMGL